MELKELPLAEYAQQLRTGLRWDPQTGTEGLEKQEFVETLTQVAALPNDSVSMEIRRLLVVESGDEDHLQNVIAALRARDVQLKCKAANAVGALCVSRVAGQQLLARFGQEILTSVTKMATSKNQWMQGDAFFVLGWMAVIADEELLVSVGALLPHVVKCLRRNAELLKEIQHQDGDNAAQRALASSEQASNFRVYGLVLLLNLSQRHAAALEGELRNVCVVVQDLLERLVNSGLSEAEATGIVAFEPSEYAELMRLAITLLSVLAGQLEDAAALLLELKIVPLLLKVKRVLVSTDVQELIGDTEDIMGILEALNDLLLGR